MRPTLLLALVAVSTFGFQFGAKPTAEQKKAQVAYDALQDKLAKATSIQLDLEVHSLDRVDKYKLSFLRENYAKIVSPESAIYQNGKTYYDYSPIEKEYWSRPAPARGLPQGTAFSLGGLAGLESIGFNNEPAMVASKLYLKKWKGLDTRAIDLHGQLDANIKTTIYLDPNSGLPVGWEFSLRDFKSSGRMRNIVLNPPMNPSAFAWNPPRGAKKIG
jgi:outer membrane lipoprotein-sorting protein